MNGFSIDGNKLAVDFGARRVISTDGTLLQFLAAAQSFGTTISFPDANKVPLYTYRGSIQRAVGDNFQWGYDAQSVTGALPQEWTNTIVLGVAPSGADIFIGQAILTRTVAPSHTWFGSTIAPVVPQGVAVQLTGSMLVEMTMGLTRSMTIDIVGSNLVAILEHSVGPAAGNFTAYGVPVAAPSTSIPPNNINVGYENNAPSGAAFPVWWSTSSPQYKADNGTTSGFTSGGSLAQSRVAAGRYGGANQAVYTDPTNYGSSYALTINGRFGRRS